MKFQYLLSASLGAFLLALGIAGAQSPAAVSGAQSNTPPQVGARIFSAPLQPNGTGHRSQTVRELNTYGPSVNFGNSGGWTITHVIEAPHIIFGTSGIDQYEGANILKNGTGDLAGLYLYVYGGGRAAQSDEGVTGLTVESGEIAGYFHGMIAGGAGAGATALTLKTDSTAQHNHPYTCVGCMLLDVSKGKIAGKLNGPSQPFGSTYLYELPTTGVTEAGAPTRLPLTQAWCTTTNAIPPTTQAGVGTSRTVNCTLGADRRKHTSFQSWWSRYHCRFQLPRAGDADSSRSPLGRCAVVDVAGAQPQPGWLGDLSRWHRRAIAQLRRKPGRERIPLELLRLRLSRWSQPNLRQPDRRQDLPASASARRRRGGTDKLRFSSLSERGGGREYRQSDRSHARAECSRVGCWRCGRESPLPILRRHRSARCVFGVHPYRPRQLVGLHDAPGRRGRCLRFLSPVPHRES